MALKCRLCAASVMAGLFSSAFELKHTAHHSMNSERIRMLQFNPHVECFLADIGEQKCQDGVFWLIDQLLSGQGTYSRQPSPPLDFGAIEYMGSGRDFKIPKPFEAISHDCTKLGTGDDVTLLYNRARWTPVGDAKGGCLGPKSKYLKGSTRPYLMQVFTGKVISGNVLVIAAHLPHPSGSAMLTHANLTRDVASFTGVEKVILMADTNLATKKNMNTITDHATKDSKSIMQDMGINSNNIQTTEGGLTCCAGFWQHVGYDRIIANFGTHMRTEEVLTVEEAEGFHGKNMHVPIIGTLTVRATSERLTR